VTETEVRRTVKGALASELRIARVDVNHRTGLVSLIPEGATDAAAANPCDRLLG